MMQLELMSFFLVKATDVPADIVPDRGEIFSFILSYNSLISSKSTYSPQPVGICISDDGGRRNRSSMIWKKKQSSRINNNHINTCAARIYIYRPIRCHAYFRSK